jgi:hypothetical protein
VPWDNLNVPDDCPVIAGRRDNLNLCATLLKQPVHSALADAHLLGNGTDDSAPPRQWNG